MDTIEVTIRGPVKLTNRLQSLKIQEANSKRIISRSLCFRSVPFTIDDSSAILIYHGGIVVQRRLTSKSNLLVFS